MKIQLLVFICTGFAAFLSATAQTSIPGDYSGGLIAGGPGTGIHVPFDPTVHTGRAVGAGARTTNAGYATVYSSNIRSSHPEWMAAGDAAAASWA